MDETICSVGQLLDWNVEMRPRKLAVVCEGRQFTYGELGERVNRLANLFISYGLKQGDRVSILLFNCIEYIEIYLAAAKTGIIANPVNYRFAPKEIEYVLKDAGSKMLIYGAEFQDVIDTIGETFPVLRDKVLVVSPEPCQGLYEQTLYKFPAAEPAIAVDVSQPLLMPYTSGTTGFPKGCINIHKAFVDHFLRYALVYELKETDYQLTMGPLFHEAPFLFSLMLLTVGGTNHIVKRFDPKEILAIIQGKKVTSGGFVVPVMFERFLDVEDWQSYDLSSMRIFMVAGAPLHPETLQKTMKQFKNAKITEFYGGTEVGIFTYINHSEYPEKGSAVGKPFLGHRLVILNDDGNETGVNQPGEIYMSGPLLIREYHNKETETIEATKYFRGRRWFTLHDVGYKDEDGYLYLVDRKKDLIISGGENIYPTEVENVLKEHPNIKDVAVVGVADKKWGETVMAFMTKVDPAEEINLEMITDFCRGRLGNYKIPRRIMLVDEIPRTESGKILRRVLKEKYITNN